MEPQGSSPAPKVIDLSGSDKPKASGIFHKKAFLGGIFGVLILTVLAVGIGWYATSQKTTPAPKAAGCEDYSITNFTGSTGAGQNVAWAEGIVKNNCDTPITVYVIKSWCKYVDVGTNGGCGAPNSTPHAIPLKKGETREIKRAETEQKVGGDGSCGSAQVDIAFTQNASGPKDRGATAYLTACQYKTCESSSQSCTPKACEVGKSCKDECSAKKDCGFSNPLVCKNVAITGGTNVITAAGENRTLTASSQGGEGAVSFGWTVSGGTLSSAAGKSVTWVAPTTLPTAATTWTVTAKAKDSKGTEDSSGCVKEFTYTPAVSYSYKTCESDACVTKTCSPATTACAKDTDCKVDGDCKPATHKECRNSTCQTVSGSGDNSCNVDGDCVAATHKTCQNNACVTVSGSGTSTCNADSDCVTATHKECQNQACVTVSGGGGDKCSSDVSCKPAAVAPAIPESGSTAVTIGALILGAGAILAGALLIL